MKIKPTVNPDSNKYTLKELIQSIYIICDGTGGVKREIAYSNLPMFSPCCQKFNNYSNNKGNAFILNPLVKVCVSQNFTHLR